MIAFTKKVDHLNTQIEQQSKEQSKALEKYIQENSLLRKEKEKLEEEVNSLRNQILLLEKQKDEKGEDI
jgi:predicted  nucleic acid-binding Zn-ribbon protein